MPTTTPTTPATPAFDAHTVDFTHDGHLFLCRAERLDDETYRPVVTLRAASAEQADVQLPIDTETAAYATEAEALRHAQQQAMRWRRDHPGS